MNREGIKRIKNIKEQKGIEKEKRSNRKRIRQPFSKNQSQTSCKKPFKTLHT